ncbi:MAG: hypothetical protein HKN54_06035 [Flavobacteriaceae bacterium]|nr:hypothetical protein [Flavobacteriaceae bacterium]
MIKRFLVLEWKQFFRSSHWQKSIAINILMVFLAVYFMATFLIMGFAVYNLLTEFHPDSDPFIVFNGFLFYWIIADLLMRFFFQKLPVMSVKPLLTLPIKRERIVHYVLGKSVMSFFNILPLFAIVPFSAILLNNGYDTSVILSWILIIILISLFNNFLNFIVESLSAETELSFLPIVVFSAALFALNYFEIVSFSELISNAVLGMANKPIFILVFSGLLVAVYSFNFKILRRKLYIDNSLKTKSEEAKSSNLEWTKKFGDIAPFMQLDIRLILRNKRSRSSLFIIIIGLLYGLFFYPNPMLLEYPFVFVFVGVFVTGVFLMTFGQFIPAWDGDYYKLLMSQNIKYEKYLKSKFMLMVTSVVVLFVLSTPYVYFGWKILLAHFAAAIYNIGVNSHVILFAGSFNRKKIELDQRAAFNYQGTGAVQWLVGIPLMIVPMLIATLFYFTLGFESAIISISLLGLLGIVFHQKLMRFITGKYQDSKYKMIEAFSQET